MLTPPPALVLLKAPRPGLGPGLSDHDVFLSSVPSLTVHKDGKAQGAPCASTPDPALFSWLLQLCSSEADWLCLVGVEGGCLETHLSVGHLSFCVLPLGRASTEAAGLFITFSMWRLHIQVPTLVNLFSLGMNIEPLLSLQACSQDRWGGLCWAEKLL